MHIIVIIIVAAVLSLPYMTGSTFHQRCSQAGYEKWDLEECVDRLSKGGRVYIKEKGIE